MTFCKIIKTVSKLKVSRVRQPRLEYVKVKKMTSFF
jgi:hypothetical protein